MKAPKPSIGPFYIRPGVKPWRCFPCLFGFDQRPLFRLAAAEDAVIDSAICCELRDVNRPRNRIDGRRLLSNDGPTWKLNGHNRQLLSKASTPRHETGHSNDD